MNAPLPQKGHDDGQKTERMPVAEAKTRPLRDSRRFIQLFLLFRRKPRVSRRLYEGLRICLHVIKCDNGLFLFVSNFDLGNAINLVQSFLDGDWASRTCHAWHFQSHGFGRCPG